MLRTVILAAIALALASPAEARHHLHHHRAAVASVWRGDVVEGRPSACAGIAWCGCWLRLRYGIADARLNLAVAWARMGSNAGAPEAGAIAVWRHHVGEIVGVPGPGRIILRSGNDGGVVREREISTRGIIAYRRL